MYNITASNSYLSQDPERSVPNLPATRQLTAPVWPTRVNKGSVNKPQPIDWSEHVVC